MKEENPFLKWYRNNPENRRKQQERVMRSKLRKREFFIKAKEKPCADCGVQYEHFVMEFDHVRGEKMFNVSESASHGWQSIKEEIEKCDVVCSNCHQRRTYIRANQDTSYKRM